MVVRCSVAARIIFLFRQQKYGDREGITRRGWWMGYFANNH
jgi:hypothetical protein